jgi:hypothetical protein
MKLKQLLEELTLELNMPKPEDAYKFDKIASKNLGYGDYYKYAYTNIKGDPMEVTVMSTKNPKNPGLTFYVAFGEDITAQGTKNNFIPDPSDEDEDEEAKYDQKTGAGDTLKVLATVVQAIKNTANKIGGMDKVYDMAWAPSDKKRKSIYDYYVQTLFPDFKKSSTEESKFQTYVNQNFKAKKVNEIGLDSEKMEPYRFTTVEDGEERRVYSFKTDSGLNYIVELEEEENEKYGMVLYIDFGVVDEDGITAGSNQNVVTNKGEQYRIMNTLSAIVKEDLAINQYIKYITFNPSKRKLPNPISGKEKDADISSNARANLYTKYIKGRLPNAKEIEDPNYGVLIKIK